MLGATRVGSGVSRVAGDDIVVSVGMEKIVGEGFNVCEQAVMNNVNDKKTGQIDFFLLITVPMGGMPIIGKCK